MRVRVMVEDWERGDQRGDGRRGHVRLLLDARAHLRRGGAGDQEVLQLQRRRRGGGRGQVRRGHDGGRRGAAGHRHLQHLRAQLQLRGARHAAHRTLGTTISMVIVCCVLITYSTMVD